MNPSTANGSVEVKQMRGMTISALAQAVRERGESQREAGWQTMTEIAEQAGSSHSSTENLVFRLVRDGKVERKRVNIRIGGVIRNCYVYRMIDGG